MASQHLGQLPARLVSLSSQPHVALASVGMGSVRSTRTSTTAAASFSRNLVPQMLYRACQRTPQPHLTTRVYQTSAYKCRTPIDRPAAILSRSTIVSSSPHLSSGAAVSSPAPSLLSSSSPSHTTYLRPRTQSLLSAITSRTIMATASHSHGGHGHHHHDNPYLTSANKNDAGVRITRIGLFSNLGMAIAKGVGGYAFNSQAMIADAWHSLTDLASDVLTLATVSWSLKPPTDKFPMGFGKVESLGALGVSSMLLFGGMFMCVGSCETLYAHFFLDPETIAHMAEHGHGGHGHSHSHAHGLPSIHAVWLAAGTIGIKEWLYRATMKVARERKSSVLESNAVHHRVDSWTGMVTLAAVLGANLFPSLGFLDAFGGLVISALVIKAGGKNTYSALLELADRSIDDEIKGSVRKQAMKVLSGPEAISEGHEVEICEISGIKSGQNYLIDMELAVPNMWTVEDLRGVEDAIRTRVGGKVRGVRRVRIRFVPKDRVDDKFDEYIPGDVSPKTSPEPEDENNHDHHDHDDHGHEQDNKKSR